MLQASTICLNCDSQLHLMAKDVFVCKTNSGETIKYFRCKNCGKNIVVQIDNPESEKLFSECIDMLKSYKLTKSKEKRKKMKKEFQSKNIKLDSLRQELKNQFSLVSTTTICNDIELVVRRKCH